MAADAIDRAFAALADGTRRGVIELLRDGPRRAGELANKLKVSPPALTRHLRILRQSRLVDEQPDADDGRARIYRLRRDAFTQLGSWIAAIEALWQENLESFAAHVSRRTKSPTAEP